MDFRFTKQGGYIMAFSLIPIAPVLSLFPGIFATNLLDKITHDCTYSYELLEKICISGALLIIITTSIVIAFVKHISDKRLFQLFIFSNIWLYLFINNAGLIIKVGPELCCHGDGQTALAVIYSAPFASLSLVVFGFLLDVIRYVTCD